MNTIGYSFGSTPVVAMAGSTNEPGGSTASSSALLPEPDDALMLTGDPGADIAMLSVKAGLAQRKDDTIARQTQQGIERTEDAAQVEDMRRKADSIATSGLLVGAVMVGEAGLTFASADEIGPKGDPTPAGLRVKAGIALDHAASTVIDTQCKSAQAMDDADAAQHKAAADQARSAADDMHDAKKDGADLVSAALDFYREYSSAKASERSAALQR